MSRSRTVLLVAALGLAVLVPEAVANAGPVTAPLAVDASAGGSTTVPSWRLRSSAHAGLSGGVISRPGYSDAGWSTVPARSTVLAGLIAAGKYPDITRSETMKSVDPADFRVPWWYRTTFTAPRGASERTFLALDGGVIPRGEVWLNGRLVAGSDEVVGAYPTHEFDVTALLREGVNALAIRAEPADPQRDLAIHFIDWAQLPPDRNQGLFRDVRIVRGGAVSLRAPRVDTDLPLPSLDSADVTVRIDARNNTARRVATEVAATVAGRALRQRVTLAPHETRTVTFAERIDRPRVWWPFQMGEQPLHEAALTARVGGTVVDRSTTTFGVREVSSELVDGARRFRINGQPFLVRGGGWASDLFLRTNVRNISDQLGLVRDMGMNTLRLEGKPENDELYDVADRLGVVLLTGWECCSKWEDYESFDDEDRRVAGESAESEARRIRNHPSLIGFLIGSDDAPPADLETIYLDALERAGWTLPVISSAKRISSPRLGDPGMKMDGPYWWVPPAYWYGDRAGGAFGFASEIGPGPTIPEMEELRKFLSREEIDRLLDHDAPQYHLAPSETFDSLSSWGTALEERYGPSSTPDELVRDAQLANYEVNRAQFEAFGRNWSAPENPATGMIYWMVNDAWPTMYWHLYDHELATAGSYFGAKTALRPLHVQHSYDDRSVAVVNTGLRDVAGLTARTTVFDLDGTVRFDETWPVTARANASVRVGETPLPEGVSTTYFTRLLLTDAAGKVVDRNVYWLSTKADELDHDNATWYHTPQSAYADLTGLRDLAPGTVSVTAQTSGAGGGKLATDVTVRNTGTNVAFFLRASLRAGAGGPEVLPTTWSDNHVTLWPGEELVLRAEYRASDLRGATPSVRLSGYDLAGTEVPAPRR
jgi:exo-1,4-beta-D-glucosaminidase